MTKNCKNCLLKNVENGFLCNKYISEKKSIIDSDWDIKLRMSLLENWPCRYWIDRSKLKNRPENRLDNYDVKIEIESLTNETFLTFLKE